jgi:hypothetical protein
MPRMGKGAQGRGSIFFDHEGAKCTDSRYHRRCSGRWRGEISKGFWPDGRRRRHKASGRTKQDVIDALKRKAGPAPVGPVSCVYRIDARHVNRDADLALARDRIGGLSQLQLAPGHRTH